LKNLEVLLLDEAPSALKITKHDMNVFESYIEESMLEQNVFNIHYPQSFDDNNVLKIVNWIC